MSVDVQERMAGQKRGRGEENCSVTCRDRASFIEGTQTGGKTSAQTQKVKEGVDKVLLHAEDLLKKITKHQTVSASQKVELEQRHHDLKKQLAEIATTKGKLSVENGKNSVKSSSCRLVKPMMQHKVDKSQLELAEVQKMELKDLNKRILDLESQLESKQGLALKLDTLKSFCTACDNLQEEQEKLQHVKELTQVLTTQDRKLNGELHGAREELINVLEHLPNSGDIGTKRVGELKSSSFLEACKQRYPEEMAEVKAVELCSLWEANLRDPDWYPFKTVRTDGVHQAYT